MHRFYCPHTDFSKDVIIITEGDEIHHAIHVVRLKPGEEVTLFDGAGSEAAGVIQSLNKKEARIQILSHKKNKPLWPKIILACAIPKKSKFETIIEKATELGVDEIIPLQTQRTEVRINKEGGKKSKRFEDIAINACKQSKRSYLPKIHPITSFNDAFKLTANSSIIIPSLWGETKPLLKVLPTISNQSISFFIGPEGDFTPDEYKEARNKGAIAVSLGPMVLRVETAAICVVACARQFFNNE